MFSLTMKGLWAHKLRYARTGLAVVLGVAFMVGTLVLTGTMKQTFDEVFESANDGIDVIVRSDSAVETEMATVRDRVEAGVVAEVAAVDGVAAARGSVQGVTQLVEADGTITATEGLGVTTGANWIDDERLNPFTLSSGRAPRVDGEAVVDENTADDQGWKPGDEIRVLTKTGPAELTVVGTARYGELGGVPGSSLVATTDATAQRLFAEPGRYDRVLVAAADGVSATELTRRVGAAVAEPGSGLEALTGKQETADQQAGLQDDLAFIDQFLMAFAYVSLFVGTFIIYNTFSIVVAQRLKGLALLRAIGARRGQVLRSVVLESAVVGAFSAALGSVAGVGLSYGLRAMLAGGGLDVPDGPLVVSSSTIMTGLVVGTLVCVLSALVPAVRAGRVRPIAALRDVAVAKTRPSVVRVVAGVLVTAGGAAAFVAGLSATEGLSLIGLGATAVVLGVFVLGPVLVGPAVRLLGAPAGLLGVTGHYARENARRNPKRTAATAAALMIGVTLVGFITIFASSTKESISVAIDSSFKADYVVESGSWAQGFATTVEDDLRAVPGVAAVSPVRSAPAEVGGSTVDVMATDTAGIEDLYDLKVTSGSMSEVHGDGVAVAATKSEADGLAVGDPVAFRFADGEHVTLAVRAVFDSAAIGNEATWMVGLDTFEAHVSDQFDRRVFVKLEAGVRAGESRDALESTLRGWPNAELQDHSQFRDAITSQVDQLLSMIYGLLALAVVIALLGITNTLALSVHERTRELGLLRAVGMHRRQVRRAVRWESLLIAGLGTALGVVLAVGAAWAIVRALADQGFTRLAFPVGQLAFIVAMAGVAGVLAARGPARRAARLDVLDAIASE